jgi:hypothetical protein
LIIDKFAKGLPPFTPEWQSLFDLAPIGGVFPESVNSSRALWFRTFFLELFCFPGHHLYEGALKKAICRALRTREGGPDGRSE